MIVAGFGFRHAASVSSLRNALVLTGLESRVSALATLGSKADTITFMEFTNELDLPVHKISEDQLLGIDTPTNSDIVRAHHKTGSVAEASALVAAGAGAQLLCERVISQDRMATCAIAGIPDEGENT